MAYRTISLLIVAALGAGAVYALTISPPPLPPRVESPRTVFTPNSAATGPQLQLSADASATVKTDLLTVTLAYEASGTDVAALTADVLKNLNDAMSKAKKISEVEAYLDSVQSYPIGDFTEFNDNWRVRGELELRSKNVQGLSDLTGSLSQSLRLTGASYSVSRELAAKTREALIVDAATAFKSKAELTANALGFKSYVVSNVALSDTGSSLTPSGYVTRVSPGMRLQTAPESMPTLPDGARSERLSVSLTGTVDMK